MKNVFLIFTLLIGFNAFSQELVLKQESSKEIKLKNGRFYINESQIPSYQMKKVFASNLHSLQLFKQAKTKETLGGALLGLGTALTIVDLAIGLLSDVNYPTALTYVGLSAIAVSVPILSGRRKKIIEAVKSYNEELKSTTSIDFDMNAVVNQNGIGFQIKF